MKPRTNKYKEDTLLIGKLLELDRLEHNEYIFEEGLLWLEKNHFEGEILNAFKYSTAYWDWFYHQWCIRSYNILMSWNKKYWLALFQEGRIEDLKRRYFNQENNLNSRYPAEPIIEKIYIEYETRKADRNTNSALSKENRTIGIRAGRNFPEKERQATSSKSLAK